MGWIYKISVGIMALALGSTAFSLNIKYSSGVSAAKVDLIQQDLQLLSGLQWSNQVDDLQRIFKMPEINSRVMEDWLGDRVSYLIDEKHPLDMSSIRVLNVKSAPTRAKNANGNSGTAVLRNIGVEIYSSAKLTGVKLGLDVEGQGTVPVLSPRVGLIQMFSPFFMSIAEDGPFAQVGEFVNRIFRISTLFHEARHSDGNGESLGFRHVACPKGHNFEGLPACDKMANGAYRIQALVLESIEKGCETCSPGQKEVLRFVRADALSRILSPLKDDKVTQPETTMQKLCAIQRQLGQNIAFCEDILTNKAIELDDKPEGLDPQ